MTNGHVCNCTQFMRKLATELQTLTALYHLIWRLNDRFPGSHNSPVGIATHYGLVCNRAFRRAVGPIQPLVQWAPRLSLAGTKSAEVENMWSFISISPCAFLAWCLIKHGDSFSLPLSLRFWISFDSVEMLLLLNTLILETGWHRQHATGFEPGLAVLVCDRLPWGRNITFRTAVFASYHVLWSRVFEFLAGTLFVTLSLARPWVQSKIVVSTFHWVTWQVPG